jgi:hypothetical protein
VSGLGLRVFGLVAQSDLAADLVNLHRKDEKWELACYSCLQENLVKYDCTILMNKHSIFED